MFAKGTRALLDASSSDGDAKKARNMSRGDAADMMMTMMTE